MTTTPQVVNHILKHNKFKCRHFHCRPQLDMVFPSRSRQLYDDLISATSVDMLLFLLLLYKTNIFIFTEGYIYLKKDST
jgi:hypothetical protein